MHNSNIMEPREMLQQMIFNIAKTEFEGEVSTYEAIEDYSFTQLYDKKNDISVILKEENGHNEFLSEAGAILSSLSLLAGTIKTYFEIKKIQKEKENKEINNAEIEKKWKDDLVANGIPAEKAEELSKKYHADLIQLVKGT